MALPKYKLHLLRIKLNATEEIVHLIELSLLFEILGFQYKQLKC